MPPPNERQTILLQQGVASGLLDNIARRSGTGTYQYMSCKSNIVKEVLFIDRKSSVLKRSGNKRRQLPEWVCFDTIVRKSIKSIDNDEDDDNQPRTMAVMKTLTPLDPTWIGSIAEGSALLKFEDIVIDGPAPIYNRKEDAILVSSSITFKVSYKEFTLNI